MIEDAQQGWPKIEPHKGGGRPLPMSVTGPFTAHPRERQMAERGRKAYKVVRSLTPPLPRLVMRNLC